MNRLVSLEPSNVVAIRIEAGQKCYGQLTLRNVMYTMPVAFKLQPLIKSRYSVKPHSGIIAPLQKITVEIIYHLPPGGMTLPDSFPHSDDSFLLHSVVVPGAATNNKDYDAVPSDWFTTKRKQVFSDSGIKIMFVGSPILARLVMDGTMEEVREVLEMSDPSWEAADSVDSDGQSLLHSAIAQGRPDLVQLILEFGPDLEAQSRSGSTPIEVASEAGEALIVELLLARKACCERSPTSAFAPIHLAARNGHVEVLRLLILKGANVDALTKDNGYTALHLAVEERKRDCARLLLASGARADSRDIVEGDTPLHIAAALGDEHMVKLLLQKGANKDVRNYAHRTPYDVAAENGHSRLFDVLRLGDSLCLAARKGEVRTILRLLENGAAVNGRDQHGWTALHRACFKGRVETVQALIEKGVEVDAEDEEGYTALHCAAESGHGDVIELSVKNGVDVEARTNKGVSAMQIAESLHYVGITRILVQGGASRDQNNIVSHVNPSVSGYNNASTLGFVDKKMDFTEGDQKGGLLNKKNRTRGKVLRGSFVRSTSLAVV